MLNLNPETVQLLAALVILPPLAYLARWLRRYRQRPRITDRGYIVGRDQFRSERKAVLHELQRGRFTMADDGPKHGPPLSTLGHQWGRPYSDGYATCACGARENSREACVPCPYPIVVSFQQTAVKGFKRASVVRLSGHDGGSAA